MIQQVAASEWTPEDRALMAARAVYRSSLCPGCGEPKDEAWHPDNEGWYEPVTHVCWACTSLSEPGEDGRQRERKYHGVRSTRDYATKPLPPWPASGVEDEREVA